MTLPANFHPVLVKLLEKLANPSFSVRDCSSERFDWVKAGCPVFDFDTCDRCGKVYTVGVTHHDLYQCKDKNDK